MVTTGKKRLTIEYEKKDEQYIRDFKAKAYQEGKTIQEVLLSLIRKYNR